MMKSLLSLTCVSLAMALNAQEIFNYNFNDGKMPASIILVDNDGNNPDDERFEAAWIVDDFNTAGFGALSTSYYKPSGQADDWMIIPNIQLPSTINGNLLLMWDAAAGDEGFPDGYQVKLSTATTSLADFSNELFGIDEENPDVTHREVDLGAYAGQTVHIAFRNNSEDRGVLFIDNIALRDVGEPKLTVKALNFYAFHKLGNTELIQAVVKENAGTPLTAVNYKFTNNGVVVDQGTRAVNIPAGEQVLLNFPFVVSQANANNLEIEIWADGEEDLSDNKGVGRLYGLSSLPAKKVLIEEATGTWCGWCPRGHVAMYDLHNNHSDKTTLVAVHGGDVMEVPEYIAGFESIVSGYPSGTIDRRSGDIDPDAFVGTYAAFSNFAAPASITGESVRSGDLLTVTIHATFATDYEGYLHFNAILTENEVTGTTSAYAQRNYYSYQSNNMDLSGAGRNWRGQPDPVPAADMVYDNVARAIIGGFEGQHSAKGSFKNGETYTHTFWYDLRDADIQNFDNTHTVIAIQDPKTGAFLNSEELSQVTGIASPLAVNDIAIMPNPATDKIEIGINESSTITIIDLHGKVVLQEGVDAGASIDISQLVSGVYVVKVSAANASYVNRLVKQ